MMSHDGLAITYDLWTFKCFANLGAMQLCHCLLHDVIATLQAPGSCGNKCHHVALFCYLSFLLESADDERPCSNQCFSASVLAQIPVRASRRSLIYMIRKIVFRIKVSKQTVYSIFKTEVLVWTSRGRTVSAAVFLFQMHWFGHAEIYFFLYSKVLNVG